MGEDSTETLPDACRVLFLRGLNVFCEIGIITASLIDLLSNRHSPDADSGQYKEELIIILLSISTTLVVLSLTIVGAGSASRGLTILAMSMSARFSNARVRVVPGNDSMKAAPSVSASYYKTVQCYDEPSATGASDCETTKDANEEASPTGLQES